MLGTLIGCLTVHAADYRVQRASSNRTSLGSIPAAGLTNIEGQHTGKAVPAVHYACSAGSVRTGRLCSVCWCYDVTGAWCASPDGSSARAAHYAPRVQLELVGTGVFEDCQAWPCGSTGPSTGCRSFVESMNNEAALPPDFPTLNLMCTITWATLHSSRLYSLSYCLRLAGIFASCAGVLYTTDGIKLASIEALNGAEIRFHLRSSLRNR